uniref:Uncharacterized protein n=1 Tax=Photinus pyralis TaxID=7054 RepID=A0A1Y1KYC3_PHOPY
MFAITIDEDVQLDAMQRAWQSKRVPSLFEEPADYQDLFSPLNQNKSRCSSPAPPLSCCDATVEHDVAQDTVQEVLYEEPHEKSQTLDASVLGDLPASYSIHGLKPHQQPVVGVYIDRRVCPGFKYKVQPLPGSKEDDGLPYLFDGKALTLKSIGRGYARRFTFESDKGRFNNENYFWSDNRPEGFGFELELVSDGDKFTVFDANHEAQGTLEILRIKATRLMLLIPVSVSEVQRREL